MGRHKKVVEEIPEVPKKIEKKKQEVPKKIEEKRKFRCTIQKQWRDFDSQIDARNMLKKVLDSGEIYFCSLTSFTK